MQLNGRVSVRGGVAALLGACVLIVASQAHALPFNDDMVNNQLRTGALMRESVPGSVPVGSVARFPVDRTEANNLKNPVAANARSIANGSRLFRANCFPCHGDISKEPHVPGPVSTLSKGAMASMDIGSAIYQSRTDGQIFGVVQFGSPSMLMYPLGWKFTPEEIWDVVNYVRKAQQDRTPVAVSNTTAANTNLP